MSPKERLTFEELSDKEFISTLRESVNQYNCEITENIFADKCFFIAHSEFDQIFMILHNNMNKEILKNFSKINLSPYSIGIPILRQYKGKFFPTVSMGNLLVKFCKNKVSLDDPEIEKLTYNKSVIIDKKIEFNYGIAIDRNNDFISYVKLVAKKNRNKFLTEVIPTLDIGWYLREGG